MTLKCDAYALHALAIQRAKEQFKSYVAQELAKPDDQYKVYIICDLEQSGIFTVQVRFQDRDGFTSIFSSKQYVEFTIDWNVELATREKAANFAKASAMIAYAKNKRKRR